MSILGRVIVLYFESLAGQVIPREQSERRESVSDARTPGMADVKKLNAFIVRPAGILDCRAPVVLLGRSR